MAARSERRSRKRSACRASIHWSLFNHDGNYSAIMNNFSTAGAFLESSFPVSPGASILMQLKDYIFTCEEPDRCPWPRSVVLAEVKWCLELEADTDRRFGLGVRYHSPA